MKYNYNIISSGVLLLCILIFGFSHKKRSSAKKMITWSAAGLTWDDFEPVNYVIDGFDASISSSISCPNLITEADSKIYAFMDPNRSERLKNLEFTDQLLTHEQYHFNITEYCARLLRKDIVEKSLGGLSIATIKSLKTKYEEKLEELHNIYDSVSDHNGNTKMQRYWELKIDDWLRQTAYYSNEDVYSYYNFTKNRTSFFRNIYFTFTHKVLTSYPVEEKDIKYGETYEILFPDHNQRVVKFYKDGKLTNGGYFETAIAKIIEKENGLFEIHYYNPDESYNSNLLYCVRITQVDKDKNSVEHYLDVNGNRVYRNSIFETQWKYDPITESYHSSYMDKKGRLIPNDNGIFHEKRVLDKKERTIVFEGSDKKHRAKNDKYYIAKYEMDFNDDHKRTNYRLYDESGDFAYHLNDYNLTYEFDERGNINKITTLDNKGERTYDQNGASIYEYTYDLYDRETSVKRYNKHYRPVIANDDYFHKVKEYDSLGRVLFEAYYYPGYVMKFTDSKLAAQKYTYQGDSIILEHNVDVYNNVFEDDNNVAVTRRLLNPKMETIKETFLDASGNYAKTEDNVVEYKNKYDLNGNTIETVAFDSLGHRKEFDADVAIICWEYDERGNKLKTTYYNKDYNLAITADSVTYNIYKYDNNNRLIERTNYNQNMKPSEISNVFRTRFYINSAGLDSLVLSYNKENELINGAAITKLFYNKYGNKERLEYYNSYWERTKDENGISAINYIYDKRQLLTGYEYFDEKDRLTENQHGVAVEKWDLDDLGHTLTYEYYDKKMSRIIGDFNYHKVDYEWNELGQTIKTTTYNEDLALIEDEYGTAIYKYTLAPSGLIQIIERFNKDGVLAENTEKVAISHYTPELNGLYFLEKELNARGEIVNDSIVKKTEELQ